MDNREILRILASVNSEIMNYKGDNLIEDHVINSFDIIEIISEIEDTLGIDIDPELIVWNRFVSIEAIIEFIHDIEKIICVEI